jgi:NADH dehydrogenase FAD-containing subunit
MTKPQHRRLILLGGGHAHIEVLRQAARRRFDGEILVISPSAHSHYSGMIPGFVRGAYTETALAIDVDALARAAGGTLREGCAATVAADGRSVTLEDGDVLECDLVSADVGSEPSGLRDVPGAAQHAFTARPINRARILVRVIEHAIARAHERAHERRASEDAVAIVGGGGGAVEIAFAIRGRAEAAGVSLPLTLIEAKSHLLPEFESAVQQLVHRALRKRSIDVLTSAMATSVTADEVSLADGRIVPSTVTVWLGGAAPVALTRNSSLPKDARDFWTVDSTLRSIGGAPVWGAGDCIGLRDFPWVPKAGVYAVREGPVLTKNLRAAMAGDAKDALATYQPQQSYLSILETADGSAIMRWKGRAFRGRAALWLKSYIDSGFVARYGNVARAHEPHHARS